MSVNPATRLILDPLWRMLDAEDRAAQVAEAWYTRHEKEIETSKAEHGLSDTDVALDPREYLAFDDPDLEKKVSTYGHSWQLKEIDGIAQKLDAVGENFLANQLHAFLVEETVGETYGVELRRWVEEVLEIQPCTSDETEISPPGPEIPRYPNPETYARDALRYTFGTHLSKGGVAPRTAQAAMRHSNIDLPSAVDSPNSWSRRETCGGRTSSQNDIRRAAGRCHTASRIAAAQMTISTGGPKPSPGDPRPHPRSLLPSTSKLSPERKVFFTGKLRTARTLSPSGVVPA